jgi:tetratricopeptide (TPR) repeat protein
MVMAYDFDVFLSHNSKDKPAVEAIARLLQREYHLRCWLDKRNLVPGEPWQERLEDALDASGTVAVFLGPNTISPWENEEMRSALEERAQNNSRRVIPVLLPGAPDSGDLKIPRFLKRLTWVDFRPDLYSKDALYRLYCGIKGKSPESVSANSDPGKPTGELPYGSYIPFVRNINFTGRKEKLEILAENLLTNNPTNTVISQAVTGMGGLGKTQLAVEFAYRYGHRFKGVHWLDLRDPQALDGAITLCGIKMGYTQADQRELIASTMKTWEGDGPRLLILDNFEKIDQANDVLARFQHSSLKILVTSRRNDFPESLGLKVQELGLFTEAESLDFLIKTLHHEEGSDIQKVLVKELGYLPLALELAVKYINIAGIGIGGYLAKFTNIPKLEAEQVKWLEELDVTSPTKHDQSLFGTFQLSWREVKDKIQQKIFMLAGYCAPNTPIPREIFKETLVLKYEDLSIALYRLNALGLLPVTNELPSIHPLLAAYARTLDASSKDLLIKLADILATHAKQAKDKMDETGSPGWFVPLHPHVVAAIEAAEEVDKEHTAILLSNLGHYLYKVADYQGAKSAFERALKIDDESHGPRQKNVVSDVSNLGSAMRALGDLVGAKAALERVLKINESTFGPHDPKVATDVNKLGVVLKEMGDLAGARAAFERALKIHETAYGPKHEAVAIDVNNLGSVLKKMGDLAGARAAYERALKIGEAEYGPSHTTVATISNNLGSVLQDLGDLAGARAAYERALRIFKQLLPEGHPSIRIVQVNLHAVSKLE